MNFSDKMTEADREAMRRALASPGIPRFTGSMHKTPRQRNPGKPGKKTNVGDPNHNRGLA